MTPNETLSELKSREERLRLIQSALFREWSQASSDWARAMADVQREEMRQQLRMELEAQ